MSFAARIFGICVFGFLTFLSAPLSAQNASTPNSGVSGVLLDFGDMSNGWHLNARCKALSRAERREFEWGYLRLRSLIGAELGEEPVKQITKTATEFAKAKTHENCGPDTKKFISRALVTSRHMNKALLDSAYDPETSYKEHLSKEFMIIETGLRIDATCRHIQPSLLATIGRVHDAMIGYTIQVVGGNAINKLLSDAEKATKQPQYEECGPETEKAVHAASKHLRELIELIEHDAMLTK